MCDLMYNSCITIIMYILTTTHSQRRVGMFALDGFDVLVMQQCQFTTQPRPGGAWLNHIVYKPILGCIHGVVELVFIGCKLLSGWGGSVCTQHRSSACTQNR